MHIHTHTYRVVTPGIHQIHNESHVQRNHPVVRIVLVNNLSHLRLCKAKGDTSEEVEEWKKRAQSTTLVIEY